MKGCPSVIRDSALYPHRAEWGYPSPSLASAAWSWILSSCSVPWGRKCDNKGNEAPTFQTGGMEAEGLFQAQR